MANKFYDEKQQLEIVRALVNVIVSGNKNIALVPITVFGVETTAVAIAEDNGDGTSRVAPFFAFITPEMDVKGPEGEIGSPAVYRKSKDGFGFLSEASEA